MAYLALRRYFDNIAAPSRFTPPRRATGDKGLRRPSSPPPRFLSSRGATSPGAGWLGGWRSGFSSAGGRLRLPKAVTRPPAVPSMRQGLAALGRVVTVTQAELAHRSHGPAHQAGGGPTH